MSIPLSPSSEGSIDDLDLSILKQVKVAINRVAETQQDLERKHDHEQLLELSPTRPAALQTNSTS